MNLSMQPRTISPTKYSQVLASQDFSQPGTVKKAYPLNNQSPYIHSPVQNKMNFSIVSEDTENYRIKCYELERELAKYKADNELQRMVQQKSGDLEYKVVEVLESNNALQGQLERAQKVALQRKSESEMWKQKYEAQMGSLMQIRQNYETEIKALTLEVQKANARNSALDQEKNRIISDQRNVADNQTIQVQETFKRSNSSQADMYEAQLKKLRDMLEDRTLQVAQLQSQIERQKIEFQDSQLRLMNEIDITKSRLSAIQIDHQNELLAQKQKLELYQETNLRNQQTAHENQQDVQVSEIVKLKNLLEIKAQEIETLINQNQKLKIQSESDISGLRIEIEILRRQILSNEQLHQQENHNIQTNLDNIHNNDTTSLKMTHENQLKALHQEILKLKEIIDHKNQDIQKLVVEKQQQKDYYDGEIQRLINTIEDQKRKAILLENEKNREIADQHARIERLTIQYENMQIDLQKQIQLLSQEIINLKNLLDHKNQEIQQNLKNYSQIKLEFEDKLRNLQNELELVKLRSFETEKSKFQEIQDLKSLIKDIDTQNREKQKQLEQQIDHQKYEIQKTFDMYNNKLKECENLTIQRNNAELIQKRIQDENDKLIDKLHNFEQEKNLEIDELRLKMDSGAAYQFENLKSAYNTQVGLLSDQIADLQNQLAIKNKELTEMIEKYTILDKSLLPETLVSRAAYNSRIGIPAELLANKSIHDATLKSQLRNSPIQRY
ncbi:unnamed protein product [Paramecium sonneborni]|uniref:Uncharacterized protein n=1 Tax=Paramecium sonneborni TaxID=65129 RepID=A0A8S1MT93_9CILI|nr:unnamed protein product [Paramecium sonneborni]